VIGERLRQYEGSLPDYEIAFNNLPDSELEPCFQYERLRELSFVRERGIFVAANKLEKEQLNENERFRRQLDLQSELDTVRGYCRPWLSLLPKEKAAHMPPLKGQSSSALTEPVRLASEQTRVESFFARSSGKRQHLELIVDWSRSNKDLVKSFLRLLKCQRGNPGTVAKNVVVREGRGRRATSKERLFQFAIWRCRKAGLNTEDTLNSVKQLGKSFNGPDPETLKKKLSSIEHAFERAFFRFPL
jgi:hypothetical protein